MSSCKLTRLSDKDLTVKPESKRLDKGMSNKLPTQLTMFTRADPQSERGMGKDPHLDSQELDGITSESSIC